MTEVPVELAPCNEEEISRLRTTVRDALERAVETGDLYNWLDTIATEPFEEQLDPSPEDPSEMADEATTRPQISLGDDAAPAPMPPPRTPSKTEPFEQQLHPSPEDPSEMADKATTRPQISLGDDAAPAPMPPPRTPSKTEPFEQQLHPSPEDPSEMADEATT